MEPFVIIVNGWKLKMIYNIMMKITDFFKTKELHGKNQGTYILIGNLNKRKNLLPVIKFIGDRKTHLSQK